MVSAVGVPAHGETENVGGRRPAVKGRLAPLVALRATLDSRPPPAVCESMSRHTHRCVTPKINRQLPRGRVGLHTLDIAVELAAAVGTFRLPRGFSHLRDHLVRAADNPIVRSVSG